MIILLLLSLLGVVVMMVVVVVLVMLLLLLLMLLKISNTHHSIILLIILLCYVFAMHIHIAYFPSMCLLLDSRFQMISYLRGLKERHLIVRSSDTLFFISTRNSESSLAGA